MGGSYRVPAYPGDKVRARLALQIMAASTGVAVEKMTAPVRLEGRACRARWLAMYLTHITFDWPLDRVGLAFGLNRSTAAQACRWVEDERDLPWLDALLERSERWLRDVVDAPHCELPA